ncbi:unnamed protein product [Leuciscus chuanchicus]
MITNYLHLVLITTRISSPPKDVLGDKQLHTGSVYPPFPSKWIQLREITPHACPSRVSFSPGAHPRVCYSPRAQPRVLFILQFGHLIDSSTEREAFGAGIQVGGCRFVRL